MLLHHAIKHEYGGWRVWVDTLAIVHSKVKLLLMFLEWCVCVCARVACVSESAVADNNMCI